MFSVSRFTIAAAVATLAIGAQPAAAATLINVQFAGFAIGGAAAQTGAAAIGSTGERWNRLAGNAGTAALVDTGGAATGVTLTFSAAGAYTGDAGSGAFSRTSVANLMQGYLFTSTTPISAIFSGLAAGQAYTLYAFTQGDAATAGRSSTLTANGIARTNTNTNRGTFASGDNLALFSGVADSQGRIVVADAVARGEANLNGFQLNVGAVTPVPEPATWAMMIGGFLLVGAAMRRRRDGAIAHTLA